MRDRRGRRRPGRRSTSSARRAACTRSRRRASRRRPSGRSSRSRRPRIRARRSAARAPRRSGRARGRPGGSRRRCADGSSGVAANAAKRLPSAASSTRSSCETAAPEIGGIGGAESRSKHTAWPSYTVSERGDEAIEILVARPPADGGADEGRDPGGRGRSRRPPRGAARRRPTRPPGRARRRASRARPARRRPRPTSRSMARRRSAVCDACSKRPRWRRVEGDPEPLESRVRRQIRVEASGSRTRLEHAVGLVSLLREVARPADAQPVRIGDDERARPLRPAEPLLAGDRVEVEPSRVDRDRPDRLRAVDEDRQPRSLPELVDRKHLPRRPEDVGEREEPRARRDRRDDRLRIRFDDDDRARETRGAGR